LKKDIHTYTDKYTHADICIHIYIHTYIHTYVRTYTHTYIHTDTYIHTYKHTYTHTYVHTYKHTYTHTYVRTYIHTCIHYVHTYTDTQTGRDRECYGLISLIFLKERKWSKAEILRRENQCKEYLQKYPKKFWIKDYIRQNKVRKKRTYLLNLVACTNIFLNENYL
jgi:hypothetical protein